MAETFGWAQPLDIGDVFPWFAVEARREKIECRRRDARAAQQHTPALTVLRLRPGMCAGVPGLRVESEAAAAHNTSRSKTVIKRMGWGMPAGASPIEPVGDCALQPFAVMLNAVTRVCIHGIESCDRTRRPTCQPQAGPCDRPFYRPGNPILPAPPRQRETQHTMGVARAAIDRAVAAGAVPTLGRATCGRARRGPPSRASSRSPRRPAAARIRRAAVGLAVASA